MSSNSDHGSNPYGGVIDSDIADLMGISPAVSSPEPTPIFNDLFGEAPAEQEAQETEEVDFSKTSFKIPPRVQEEKPRLIFGEKDFYQKVLANEGEPSQRLHKLLTQFLNAQDPKDRSIYRGKLISAYWNLAESISRKICGSIGEEKKLLLRYGYLLPNLLTQEQRVMLARIVFDHDGEEPFYYVDEWLYRVGTGMINPSATDEVKTTRKKSGDSTIKMQMEKARGFKEVQAGVIRTKMGILESCENMLKEKLLIIQQHPGSSKFPGLKEEYNAEQKRALSEMGNLLKELSGLDKEITTLFMELGRADANLKELQTKAKEAGVSTQVDSQVIISEFNTVRQLCKMSVGRQGNHLPILMKQYFRANYRDLGTRENITMQMAAVEAVDPAIFHRTFKRNTNRIVPYVIILPCYGEKGVCWEPFEKFNRASSRGRVGIPLFPKNLQEAVITGLADLRWQVAKEKAQHYWMEEGLTGRYYQWFSERRLKGDIKESFVQDYYLWITKESEGTQKLDREVRAIFWRYIPFPEHLRESLKNRGFVYSELYKRDINRSMSDGY